MLGPEIVLPLVLFAAFGGTLIGSFLTVVAARIPTGGSIVAPASACPRCDRQLRWRENIPIVSWLALRGRCAGCGTGISARYPAIEAATAIAFAGVAAVNGFDADLALELPFVAACIVIAVIDIEHRIVPNRIVAVMAVYAIVAGALVEPSALPGHVAAGAGAFLVLLAVALAHPAGMGMGDVKLAGVLGLYLGLAVVPALLLAFLTGSLVGIAVMARHGRSARKKALPFAPFLALGGLVALVIGHQLIDLYSSTFL